jgi:hypothetical protein
LKRLQLIEREKVNNSLPSLNQRREKMGKREINLEKASKKGVNDSEDMETHDNGEALESIVKSRKERL